MVNTKKTTQAKVQKPQPLPPAEKPVQRSAKAIAKYLHIGPRKLRVVIDAIRWQSTDRAFNILSMIKKKGARMAEKVLKSAVANAKDTGLDENRLYVAEVRADGGPVMKRFMSRSMGRADKILKRMSHLSVIVKESTRQGKTRASVEQAQHAAGSSKIAKTKAPRKVKQSAQTAAKA